MIELTTRNGKILVNPLLIRIAIPSREGGTKLNFDNDHYLLVNETLEQFWKIVGAWEEGNV